MAKMTRKCVLCVIIGALLFSIFACNAAAAAEKGVDYFIYQAEDYYSGTITEGVAADLQPGETLSFRLGKDAQFKAGTYLLTVYSCGNRESFDVLVNGTKVGTISRTGTGFGQDQMTYDKLQTEIKLKPEDTLSLVAPSGSYWGWVDFIVLDVCGGSNTGGGSAATPTEAPAQEPTPAEEPKPEGDSTESGEGYILYQTEFFYDKITQGHFADLQPKTTVEIPLNSYPDFKDGWYTITIRSCGSRETTFLRINGTVIGSVSRKATEFGDDKMTEDKYNKKVELKAGDTLTLAAPDDGTYGWVDWVRLNEADPPAGATENTGTQHTEQARIGWVVWLIIGVAAAAAAAGAFVVVRRKKKS